MATLLSAAPDRHEADYASDDVCRLRADLALALRAAAYHALGEGVCNHFSLALPDGSDRFLINPRGLHWSEIGDDDIVMVDGNGARLAGRHDVEPTAMFIHAAVHRIARKACVLHTHMPYATALTLTGARGLDTTLSQNAMRFHGRVALDAHYNGLALDRSEGERIARAMSGAGPPQGARPPGGERREATHGGDPTHGADIAFLGNHGVVVGGPRMDYAYDDLYILERACMVEVMARSTGLPLVPVDAALAAEVAAQINGERLQSTLFFEALRRLVPAPR